MDNSTVWMEHRERLLRFVLSRGIEPDDAEDIVQDVLAKALSKGGGPVDPNRMVQWLYQVVRNAIVDHWRRKRPTDAVPEDLPEVVDGSLRPDGLLACLEPFLARLEPRDASILRLADAEGEPQAKIAQMLKMSLSGTKSRIQRARLKMFEMYRECCAVELDQRGRLMDHKSNSCERSPSPCDEAPNCNGKLTT